MSNDFINTHKASSHPAATGGVFEGVIMGFHNGRATVKVKQLKCTYSDVDFLGNSTRTKFKKNDRVLCTFIDNELSTLYIIGAYNKSLDIFVGIEKFNALIDALEAQLGIGPTVLDAYKQND